MIKYVAATVVAAVITQSARIYFHHKKFPMCPTCGVKHSWEPIDCPGCVPGFIYTEQGCEPYMKCLYCGWNHRLPITWEFSPQPPAEAHLGRWFFAR